MKTGKVLNVLGILVLAGVVIFGITGLVYAQQSQVDKRTGVDAGDAGSATTQQVESSLPKGPVNPDSKGKDQGSPLHAVKAIEAATTTTVKGVVEAKYEVGDIITSAEFEDIRDWSARTRGLELQSLVATNFLSRKDKNGKALPKGKYRILVIPNPEQLNEINEQVKPIVDRIGVDGRALGLNSHRLDAIYLGKGDIGLGQTKLQQIRAIVSKVTGTPMAPAEDIDPDFVQAYIDEGVAYLPASVAINGDKGFTINGINILVDLLAKNFLSDTDEVQALLAALVDTRILPPEGKVKGNVLDFSADKVKTVIFEESFVTGEPAKFKAEFDKLKSDETAVIIAINKNNADIKTALEKAGLLGQWGNRIVVMGVAPESPAAQAFGELFGDNPSFDLRGQKVGTILNNKDLVKGLAGAV